MIVRHLPPPNAMSYHLPRPIIIDTWLRLSSTCKLLQNYQNGVGRRPWVICGTIPAPSPNSKLPADFAEIRLERKEALETAGARIFEIPMISSGDGNSTRLSIPTVLQTLKEHGICSVMVEGGAQVISSFMEENVVDTLIMTIAPVFVGDAGIGYRYPVSPSDSTTKFDKLKYITTEKFGRDSVVVLCEDTGPILQKI